MPASKAAASSAVDTVVRQRLGDQPWRCTFASTQADGSCSLVYQYSNAPTDVYVASICDSVIELQPLADDQRLPGIASFVKQYTHAHLLRYRPHKRATFLVRDRPLETQHLASQEPAHRIAKLFADQRGAAIFRIYAALAASRQCLPAAVPVNLGYQADLRLLWQSCVSGQVITDFSDQHVHAVARTLAALHAGDVYFPEQFSAANQTTRTARYLKIIRQRIPETAPQLDRIQTQLAGLEADFQANTPIPLHGSPHSQQWLWDDTNERIALVDFDRAAMGDSELDLATFIAEWDFEKGEGARRTIREFLRHYRCWLTIDPARLTFYRVHKHLAKAFKYSRYLDATTAQQKTLKVIAALADPLIDRWRQGGF